MRIINLAFHRVWRALKASCLPVLLLFGCYVAHAGEPVSYNSLPARFGEGSDSLLARLECPEERGPEHRTVVFCQAHVLADGTPAAWTPSSNGFCFGAVFREQPGKETVVSGARPYVSAVSRAIKKARFIPATSSGVAVPVYFQFQVIFEDKEGCVATAYPNLGIQGLELGPDYVAPQEIVTEGSWIKRIGFFDPFAFPALGVFFSTSVLVNENGSAVGGRVDYTTPASISRLTISAASMAARAARAMEDSKYIPGFYQGAPFPMRSLGILFVGTSSTASF